ncbi:Polygalacturonase inhibitor-like protein [Drosera capensis]
MAFALLCSFLFVVSIAAAATNNVSERCHPQDKNALLRIKASFGDPYILTSWSPGTDCCRQWHDVFCSNVNNRVTEIHVVYALVNGTIPDAIGDLSYLEFLFFHKLSNLTGPIPEALSRLQRLNDLKLSWNALTGPVPGFLGRMKSVVSIDLSFNNFTGTIPPSLSSQRCSRDPSRAPLALSKGQGPIPKSLAVQNFSTLDLSWNRLTGEASYLFGSTKALSYIDLSRNVLSFDFSDVKFPTSLQYLDISHNMIRGRLPDGLTQLSGLGTFNVSYNRLCGRIPVGGRLQTFDQYSYVHNRCLCGAPLTPCKKKAMRPLQTHCQRKRSWPGIFKNVARATMFGLALFRL